jgi:hypothetical protein
MDINEKEVKRDPLFPFLVGLVGTSGCYVSKAVGGPTPSAICDAGTILRDSKGGTSDGEPRRGDKAVREYTEMIVHQEVELDALDEACGALCDGLSEMLELETSAASRIPRRDFTGDSVLDDLKERHGSALTALHSGLGEPKKKRRNLSKGATEVLNRWFFLHLHDPYPTDEEKQILSKQTGLSLSQCNNWFGNKRMRYKRKVCNGFSVWSLCARIDKEDDNVHSHCVLLS